MTVDYLSVNLKRLLVVHILIILECKNTGVSTMHFTRQLSDSKRLCLTQYIIFLHITPKLSTFVTSGVEILVSYCSYLSKTLTRLL